MSTLEPDLGQAAGGGPTFGLPDLVAQQQPVVPSPTGNTAKDPSAVLLNLPDAQTAFVRKYQELTPVMANLPSQAKAGLLRVDLQRVNKGQAPLSDKQTAAVLQAIAKKAAVTKAPESGGPLDDLLHAPGNVVGDLRAIVQSIPHLPGAIVNEAKAIPHIGEAIAANEDAGMNPLAAVLNAPGIRMVPGAFIAGNLAQGTKGLETLAEHPGFTFLDALPYAGELAAGTKVAQIAAAERAGTAFQAAKVAAESAGLPAEEVAKIAARSAARAEGAGKPLQALLLRKVNPEGVVEGTALTPTRLGRGVTALGETKPGMFLREAFGTEGRDMAATKTLIEERVRAVTEGRLPAQGEAESVARMTRDLFERSNAEDFAIPLERRTEIARMAQESPTPDWRDTLAPNEQAWLAEAEQAGRRVQDLYTSQDMLREFGGEVYTPEHVARIEGRMAKLGKGAERITERHLPLLDELIANAGDDASRARISRLRNAIADAADPEGKTTWAEVNKIINGMNQARTSMGSPKVVGEGAGPAADVRVGKLAGIQRDVRDLASVEKKLGKLTDKAPARFQPAILARAEAKMKGVLIQRGVDPEAAAEMVMARRYSDVFTEREWRRTVKDMEPAWRKLKERGHDPVWVHHVGPGSEGKMLDLKVGKSITTPTAAKERLLGSAGTYYQDLTVGLDHAAREVLQRDMNEAMLGHISDHFGMPRSVLEARYLERAQAAAESNPRLNVTGHTIELMRRDWVPWNPEQFGGRSAVRAFADPESIWIPKVVANNVERIMAPTKSTFLGAVDPITSLFRTSVLAFSPRWHVYNIVGNSMMLMAEQGPAAFRFLPEARQLIKAWNAGDTEALHEAVGLSLGSTIKEGTADARSFMEGVKAGNAWTKLQESAPARGIRTLAKKSYQLNGFFDDTTRVMAYLSGEKSALGKGLSAEAAEEAGLQAARRASQFWNELSPIERGTLRKVFPFYTFSSKIMRMIARYPMDHPWRAAILANFAEAEMADIGDGLGSDWLNSIGIGKPDAEGNQTRISMSGLNPFADAADLFTLSGFIAGANPVAGSALEAIGADVGGSSTYGTQRYDPRTGKLTDAKPGFIESLIGNTVPQVGTLLKLTGRDAEFNALLRTNPEAAQRMILSGAGLPTSIRRVNVPEQIAKAELARQTAQQKALAEALKTGDWSEAEKWPGLRPQLEALKQLRDRGLLSAYNPYAGVQPGPSVAVAAGRSIAPWPT